MSQIPAAQAEVQEFGKQQELGQERRGEHQAHASEAQEAGRTLQLAFTISENAS